MTSFTLIPRLVTNNPNPPMFLHSFKSIQTPTQIFHFPHKSFLPKTQFHVLGNAVNRQNPSPDLPISQYLRKNSILFTFSLILLSLRLLSNLFLPNFPYRWHCLLSSAQEAEWKVAHYPSHLWQAVVAYEDRRFFKHCGIDPVGIGRAVLSLSARGGGSTITQQLVKNTFLKNERTFLRKIIEMVLSLALERIMSKQQILGSYLSKIYWGHGIYGIESSSFFYFGKPPHLLSMGESTLLVGIIPAPELRSPFRELSRGKIFQARVLKRMVDVGFLDIGTALMVVNQCLNLCLHRAEYIEVLEHLSPFHEKVDAVFIPKQEGLKPTVKKIWDWEAESKIWEVREEMERWADELVRRKTSIVSDTKNLDQYRMD